MGRTLSISEIERRIAERFPNEKFEIIEYQTLGKPGKVKCCDCGKIIEVSKFGNFFAKNKVVGCKECKGLHIEREQKLSKITEQYNIINTCIKNTHTYYTIECKQCGHQRTNTLYGLYKHLECGCITGVYRNRTPQEFVNEVNKYSTMGEYELVGEYKNQLTKVLLQHKKCGMIFKVRPSDIIHGHSSCPKCRIKESKAVRYIAKILSENNIPFIQEYPLQNSKQRFDFYLENTNHKIAIEYNGEQHYKQGNFFSTTLEQQQERDARKRQYCKDNDIQLYVIPYTSTDEEILRIIKDIIFEFND